MKLEGSCHCGAVRFSVGSKANWVAAEDGPNHARFDEYPEESLADWHRRHGL